MRVLPPRLVTALLSVALGGLVTGCGVLGGPSSEVPQNAAEVSACQAAVQAAAGVAAKRRQPDDLDVAIALCPTSADFAQAVSMFADALAGGEPFAFVAQRCKSQPSLQGAPICRVMPGAAGSPGPAATLGPGEPRLGRVVFGKALGAEGRSVDAPRTAFKRTTKRIAWAAWLTDLPTSGGADLTLWRKTDGGEQMIWHTSLDLGSGGGHQGGVRDLAGAADRQPGTYTVRLLVDGLAAAEGSFDLVR
jgi:hypothetical protein